MAVQEQLPLRVKPQFLDMVWYSVSLFREGMIATLGGRNIWWSQSQGGGRRGAEYLALQCRSFTMMMQRRALAEPAQWSDQSPNMPPHPHPSLPHDTSSCPSSDIVWLPRTTVNCTFDFWDQQPPSCSLVLALSMVWFDRQLLFCLNIRLRSSNTEKIFGNIYGLKDSSWLIACTGFPRPISRQESGMDVPCQRRATLMLHSIVFFCSHWVSPY